MTSSMSVGSENRVQESNYIPRVNSNIICGENTFTRTEKMQKVSQEIMGVLKGWSGWMKGLGRMLFKYDKEDEELEDYISDITSNYFIESCARRVKQAIAVLCVIVPLIFIHQLFQPEISEKETWEWTIGIAVWEGFSLLFLVGLHFYPKCFPYVFSFVIFNNLTCIIPPSLMSENYKYFEYVQPCFTFPFILVALMPSYWKLNSAAYLLGTGVYLYRVHEKYTDVSPDLMGSMLFTAFYFTVSSVILSWKVRALYKTIRENEKLVAENKNLLQIFPHGVIIHPKGSDEVHSKCFNNREFKEQIQDIQNRISELSNIEVVHNNAADGDIDTFKTDLYSYLKKQQSRLDADSVHEDSNIRITCKPKQHSNRFILEEENKEEEDNTEERVFNIKTLEVTWEGNPSYMHVFMDTTDIKKLEEANNNIKCQQIMFASVSHEFRTPLNAIIHSYNFVRDRFEALIKRQELKQGDCDSICKFLKMGQNSSYLLMSLIEDILDLSKMEGGTFKINLSSFSLKQFLDEVHDIFEFQCHQKKISLNLKIGESLKLLSIKSDQGRLKQILLNLISNALKFTFRGGITIVVQQVRKDDSDFLSFSVKDTGIGIKEQDQSKLFKLFGMITDKNNLNPNGCGIGLTVSKKYVEKLGGKINLGSTFGEGTNITFTIPLQTQPEMERKNDIEGLLRESPSSELLPIEISETDYPGLLVKDFMSKYLNHTKLK